MKIGTFIQYVNGYILSGFQSNDQVMVSCEINIHGWHLIIIFTIMNRVTPEDIKARNIENELVYSTARSSGPGGQNVNKVNTKVELRFNISSSIYLSETEKDLLLRKLKNRINKEGDLILASQSERSMILNKEQVKERFFIIISAALTLPRRRIQTSPTKSSRVKRLSEKRKRGINKKLRKDPGDEID